MLNPYKIVISSENGTDDIAKAYTYKRWDPDTVGYGYYANMANINDIALELNLCTIPRHQRFNRFFQHFSKNAELIVFVSNPISRDEQVNEFIRWFEERFSSTSLKEIPTAIILTAPSNCDNARKLAIFNRFYANLKTKDYSEDIYLSDILIEEFNVDSVRKALNNVFGHILPIPVKETELAPRTLAYAAENPLVKTGKIFDLKGSFHRRKHALAYWHAAHQESSVTFSPAEEPRRATSFMDCLCTTLSSLNPFRASAHLPENEVPLLD